jgi:hypothetical protein
MEQNDTKKKEIILSLNAEELASWVKSRLHENDKYFPIYLGHEPYLSGFLVDAFIHIKKEEFRESFLCILESLTVELESLSIRQIEEEKDYIYELLMLCQCIKQFKNKDSLYRLARSGHLKNVFAFDVELHLILLLAIGSTPEAGDLEFWLEQLKDDSNKYYANAAFYVLLKKYEPGILFEHIGIFIDRFLDEKTMHIEFGILSIINKYGKAETFRWFNRIEKKLSEKQKNAIDAALCSSGYNIVFKIKIIENPDIIDKIAQFNIQELNKWIRFRLKGIDHTFHISAGFEDKKFALIATAYESICNRDFRDNFHEIMNDLMMELRYISFNKNRISSFKEYVYEIISLFERIPDFKDKSYLYSLAREGNFKGIKPFWWEDIDLHQMILKTLASYHGSGDFKFWIEQIKQDEDKWYVVIAFAALVIRGYRLDIILTPETLPIFLKRINDDERGLNAFNYCIEDIIDEYEKIIL